MYFCECPNTLLCLFFIVILLKKSFIDSFSTKGIEKWKWPISWHKEVYSVGMEIDKCIKVLYRAFAVYPWVAPKCLVNLRQGTRMFQWEEEEEIMDVVFLEELTLELAFWDSPSFGLGYAHITEELMESAVQNNFVCGLNTFCFRFYLFTF